MNNFWLSPNTEKDDLRLAEKMLGLHLLKRQDNQLEEKLQEKLAQFFRVKKEQIFLLNSGRSALFLLLRALRIGPKDKVTLQAYTCNAAVNPLLWVGATPVWVDIDQTGNLDPQKLRKVKRLRAVLVQHTFGLPAQIERIKKFCQQNNLFLIEDCAHALGGRFKKRLLGRWGDFAFFSFGRDKVISSVYGGALLVNRKEYLPAIAAEYNHLSYPSWWWTTQQLLHPILLERLIIPLYNFCSIGKVILYLSLKLGLISRAVRAEEKEGQKPPYFPARLPFPLTALVLKQLNKIGRFNRHRRRIARLYQRLLARLLARLLVARRKKILLPEPLPGSLPVWLRFNIRTPQAAEIQKKLRQKKVYLDRWLGQVIGPLGTKLEIFGYQPGSCPRAEKMAAEELQFPTGIKVKVKEAEKLVKLFYEYQTG